jgi:PAS domain S-box-containing protein
MDERAEHAIRDALAFAESVVDTMRDPLLVLDGDLRVVSAGREFYRAFGVTREGTEGRLVYDLGNGQWDIPRLRTLLEEVLPRSTTFRDYEVEHTFERLGRRVMLLNARRLHREQSDTPRILLVIEDVTDRRDAERARHDCEVRFAEMVKNVRDHSIFLTDPAGVITSWNVAAERVIGYTADEAVGRHFALIFTPDDVAAGVPEAELRQAREEGRAEDERWHVRKGGEAFWALGIVTPLRGPRGELTGFSKILRDITDRKRAEDALREKDLRLRAALGAARMGTWHWDIGADRQSPDEGLRRLVGLPADWEGGTLAEFLARAHPDDRPGVRGAFARSAETGAGLDIEFRVPRPDGTVRWLQGQGEVVPGPDGRPLYLTGACVDMTDRRRTEEELRQAREALERRVEERTAELRASQDRAIQAERLAAVGQMVTGLAHESRNALQRAQACLSVLELRLRDDPDALGLLARMQAAQDDLHRHYEDVCQYAAPVRLARRRADLRAVWREAWADLAALRAGRTADLVEDAGGTDLHISGDPFRLRQVFRNLLENALAAAVDPARVAVRCADTHLGGRPAVRVAVADNGPGFDPAVRDRLFEPFQTTKVRGTGLGLAICRRLVEAHGGRIDAAPAGGPGAEVILTLPRGDP